MKVIEQYELHEDENEVVALEVDGVPYPVVKVVIYETEDGKRFAKVEPVINI